MSVLDHLETLENRLDQNPKDTSLMLDILRFLRGAPLSAPENQTKDGGVENISDSISASTVGGIPPAGRRPDLVLRIAILLKIVENPKPIKAKLNDECL